MSISSRLQELRKQQGLSQEQLADRLSVTRQAISKWESEQGCPDMNNIIKLSEVFDVTTDYLLKGISHDMPQVSLPMESSKKTYSPFQKALAILAVVGGCAVCTLIFIALLKVVG